MNENKEIIKDQVDIITVHYNIKSIIPQFFESIKKITYPKYKVYFVDNASEDGSADYVEQNYKDATLIRMDKNYFFCKSNNKAIRESNGEFVLMINNDIIVEPDFLDHAVRAMKADENIAAIPIKMMLNSNPTIFDSTGSVILDNGEPFNRGIGQPDIGQYDGGGQTFGACFGSVLLRRKHLDTIGLLDEDYFGYFDDIDWCMRANLMGYKVVFEPKAKVYHAHSATANNAVGTQWKPAWKHYLIRRNFIWTAQKDFEGKMAFKITLVRYRNLIMEGFKSKKWSWMKMNLKVILVTIFTLLRTVKKRREIQKKRKVKDAEFTKYAVGEMSFFDDRAYRPLYTLDNLEFVFKKMKDKGENYNKLYEEIRNANNTKNPEDTSWIESTHKVLDNLAKYIDKTELENFRNDILIEQTWYKPKVG